LRINAGKGEVRPRFYSSEAELEASKNNTENFFQNKVIEVRGGTALLEPGAIGADFIGVTFLGDEGTMDVRRDGGRDGGREGCVCVCVKE